MPHSKSNDQTYHQRDMDERERARLEEAVRAEQLAHKALVKEAITEWLKENPVERNRLASEAIGKWMDKQTMELGRWTLRGIIACVLGIVALWAVQHVGKP